VGLCRWGIVGCAVWEFEEGRGEMKHSLKPYYQDSLVTLYHGDCRRVLPFLDGSYFLWTDPPYNVGKDYAGWNDNVTTSTYLGFCSEWIDMCSSISTEMCVYTPKKYFLPYWNLLGEQFQQIVLTWNPEGAIRYGFVDQYASLLTNAKPKVRSKNLWKDIQMRGMGYFFRVDDYGHPGYTSEDLTSRVISVLATPEAIILDPFGGTGTTAKVAKQLGRRCVIIEYSEQWCEFIAAKRLRQMSFFEMAD